MFYISVVICKIKFIVFYGIIYSINRNFFFKYIAKFRSKVNKKINKMGRLTKIDSLNKAWKVAGSQTSAQQLLNGRMYLKTAGWSKVKLTDEFRDELIDMLVSQIGGHERTKLDVRIALKFRSPQHWALDRFFLSKYLKSDARISYCAGQCHTSEMKYLRNYLKMI